MIVYVMSLRNCLVDKQKSMRQTVLGQLGGGFDLVWLYARWHQAQGQGEPLEP